LITHGHKELVPERWDRLRAVIRKQRFVRVDELCRALDVSPATVRRDLEHLEERGEIERVHGGAVSVDNRLSEPVFDAKAELAADEKQRIARAALAYLKPGDTIYVDGGSTLLEFTRLLVDHENLTVVTNSFRAATELAGRGPRLILVGGELRRLSQTMVGPLTKNLLGQVHVDTAFMGTIGLSVDEGMTTTDPGEAYTKKLVLERAGRVILLADSSKVGKVAFAEAGALENIDVLVTDKDLDDTFARHLDKQGIKITKT
jgi:DeoR/GlpR family transcriptional regulator of sugar metabolism